jgi:ParB-like chromosome segregation protein Spo0J
VSRAAGWIAPVVVVDGRVAGTWEPVDGEVRVCG